MIIHLYGFYYLVCLAQTNLSPWFVYVSPPGKERPKRAILFLLASLSLFASRQNRHPFKTTEPLNAVIR